MEETLKKIEDSGLTITGAELEVSALIEGVEYVTVIPVDNDLDETLVESVKQTVINGFKKLHQERKEQGLLDENNEIDETE